MDRVLIIGAGAAGSVVAQKCAMDRDTFKHITLASRRIESCEKVAKLCRTPDCRPKLSLFALPAAA